jgi:hypothetical protein
VRRVGIVTPARRTYPSRPHRAEEHTKNLDKRYWYKNRTCPENARYGTNRESRIMVHDGLLVSPSDLITSSMRNLLTVVATFANFLPAWLQDEAERLYQFGLMLACLVGTHGRAPLHITTVPLDSCHHRMEMVLVYEGGL